MAKQFNKKKLSEKEQKKIQRAEMLKELIPIGKAFLLWILLVIITVWDYTNHRWFSMIFIDFTTYLSYALSKIFMIPVELIGEGSSKVTTLVVNYKSIIISNYPMLINLECSAYHAYFALIALVIFSGWKIKQKLLNGFIIFAILAFINALRIIMLGVVGKNYPNFFNFMHDYVWNILLVIIIWALWEVINRKMQKRNKTSN